MSDSRIETLFQIINRDRPLISAWVESAAFIDLPDGDVQLVADKVAANSLNRPATKKFLDDAWSIACPGSNLHVVAAIDVDVKQKKTPDQKLRDEQFDEIVSEHEKLHSAMLSQFDIAGALAKACADDWFDYALKLRSGEVIEFNGASNPSGDWIRLDVNRRKNPSLPFPAPRGIDVRLSEILWVMDAPTGS